MRDCVLCGRASVEDPFPGDIEVCRDCELGRHRSDPGHLTAEGFVDGSEWQLATTMLDNPHQYTVRDLSTPDARGTTALGHAEFEWFARQIGERGRPAQWRGRTYRYLEVDGWKYWTMGSPIEMTTIIDRRPASAEARDLLDRQVREARQRSTR